MSAIAQLSQQLAQLSDSLRTTNGLISQLSKLSFQPGSEPLEGDQGSVRIELSQDIHDSLKQLEEDLELLKQEAEDLDTRAGHRRRDSDGDREKARLSAQVARLGEDLKGSRSSFRRAQLTAKKASESAKQKERELVFASLQTPPQNELPNGTDADGAAQPDLFAGRRLLAQKSKLTKEELEVEASSNVTSSLRRTHDLLSTELSRSRFAQETFDQSTAALAELGEHYSNLDTILSNSRNLLGTLLRSQKSDTWYLETAFCILIATLVWLIFRRILLGPFIRLPLFVFKWFLWKPFILFLTVTGILNSSSESANGVRATTDIVAGPRTPLIVQNSAKGAATPIGMAGRGVPVGAGGKGAKVKPAPKMVESIGRMAEETAEGHQGRKEEVERRADGTVLEARGEQKPNPKKRMFEADVEDGKTAEQRAAGGDGDGMGKDEL